MRGITEDEAEALLYEWRLWARPDQLPPPGNWFGFLLRSGRGAGKTRTGAEWIIDRAQNGPFYPIALVGQTKADVRDTMIEVGESSILNSSPPWFTPEYEPSKRRLTWPNGMIATAFSGDEPNQLRGPQHGSAWVDELAKFKYPQETWDNLEFGLRLGDKPQVVITTTPRPIPIIKALIADPDVIDRVVSTYANIHNLSPSYIKRVIRKYEGTRLGQQELHGAILGDVPGALWDRDLLERTRVLNPPGQMTRIVVAIDPAVTADEDSNETGIVVCALGSDGHGYCLDDLTLRGSPAEWGRAAIAAYYKWRADRIIAEVNNGGDMIEHVIHTIDDKVSFRQVRASRGKLTRAEPIASLYEQNKCHHVGFYADLEDQLCSWLPGEESPDRLDALVWAITELMLGQTDELEIINYGSFNNNNGRRKRHAYRPEY